MRNSLPIGDIYQNENGIVNLDSVEGSVAGFSNVLATIIAIVKYT